MAMKSVLFDRYIADGFKDDCMTLLSKFAATNSARFCDFVTVWQEMKFPTIFCGLNTFAELLEFTEEALCISKQLFLPPNPDIARIGALYLVYGVYTQQPTRGLVKIRMSPDEWIQTISFIDNVREFGYADANFIFHSLCYSAAFTFTFGSKEYGLERSYRRHQITSTHLREMMQCKTLNANQVLKPVFEDIDIEELENIRKSYENCKSRFKLKEEKHGMEFTTVTPTEEVIETLKRVVEPFISLQADASTSNTAGNAGNLTDSNTNSAGSSNGGNIGAGRQALKNRAFKQQSLGQNHLRSCLSTIQNTESVTEAPSTGETVENPKRKEEHSRINILWTEKKRRKIKVNSSYCEESSSPANSAPCEESSSANPAFCEESSSSAMSAVPISSVEVDPLMNESETTNSPPEEEKSSLSQNSVRRSNRVRKPTAKSEVAAFFRSEKFLFSE